MKFSCDGCGSQYMISDEKVGPNGVKVRCKKCGNIVAVKRAPAVVPEVAPAPPPEPPPEPRAEAGGPETTLERELGDAFENVFGGGSPGLAAEARAAQASEAPAAGEAPPAGQSVAGVEESSDWYVAVEDSQVGPLPAQGVKARWESGEVGPDTLAWRPGMADWVPISSIPEMAQYLAPVPRGDRPAARPAAAAAPEARAEAPRPAPAPMAPSPAPVAAAPAAGNVQVNGHAKGQDSGWKPSAASALAALANEEIAALQKPAPAKVEPAPAPKAGTLVDRMDLPDGGVDPTNLLPLPIKGLEPTGESALKPRPVAPTAEPTELRQVKKSARRSVLGIGVAMLVAFAGAVAVIAYVMRPAQPAPTAPAAAVAPAPAPAAAPLVAPAAAPTPPPAEQPAATAQAPAREVPPEVPGSPSGRAEIPGTPAPAGGAPAAVAQAAPPSAPAAAPAEPAAAPPQREAPPEPAARPHRRAKAKEVAEAPPARPTRKSRLAAAQPGPDRAPSPAAEPSPRRKPAGDPLLDVGGDDELAQELAGKGSKRSVYVPPAIGSDLPDSVSVSQINEAVVGQKSALLRCIDQQKAADPDTRGTLKVRWIISGDGSVRDVRVVSDEFARQPIAPCISGVVKGIRFPRTRTTGQEVVFPFKF